MGADAALQGTADAIVAAIVTLGQDVAVLAVAFGARNDRLFLDALDRIGAHVTNLRRLRASLRAFGETK